MTTAAHGIPREEWERRFRARFVERFGEDPGDEAIESELESWPAGDDDWLTEPPEDAADSNLLYWQDDGGEGNEVD